MKQTVSKQITTTAKKKDRREGKGRVLALSRRTYKSSGKSTYYVESETCDNRYYFVSFNPSVFEWCSCKDFESNRAERCKVRGKTKETSQHLSYEEDIYSF